MERVNKPGYYIHVRLWGSDAELIWNMMKEEFGDMIQPWNTAAIQELARFTSGFAFEWPREYNALLPQQIETNQYKLEVYTLQEAENN